MSVFDARALLGFYCYRAGALDDAWRIWERLPRPNLEVRPEVEEMINEVRHQVALDDVENDLSERAPLSADDPASAGTWRTTTPPGAARSTPRPRPGGASIPAQIDLANSSAPANAVPAPFWNPSSWTSAMAPVDGQPADPSATSSSRPVMPNANGASSVPVTTNPPAPARAPEDGATNGD
jgi:hypothetical protein